MREGAPTTCVRNSLMCVNGSVCGVESKEGALKCTHYASKCTAYEGEYVPREWGRPGHQQPDPAPHPLTHRLEHQPVPDAVVADDQPATQHTSWSRADLTRTRPSFKHQTTGCICRVL